MPISATQLYGCHSKPRECRDVLVQDGWTEWTTVKHGTMPVQTRLPVMVRIPNPMSADCRYDRASTDSRCAGCPNMPQQSA